MHFLKVLRVPLERNPPLPELSTKGPQGWNRPLKCARVRPGLSLWTVCPSVCLCVSRLSAFVSERPKSAAEAGDGRGKGTDSGSAYGRGRGSGCGNGSGRGEGGGGAMVKKWCVQSGVNSGGLVLLTLSALVSWSSVHLLMIPFPFPPPANTHSQNLHFRCPLAKESSSHKTTRGLSSKTNLFCTTSRLKSINDRDQHTAPLRPN